MSVLISFEKTSPEHGCANHHQSDAHFDLLGLPVELQQEIYQYLLPSNTVKIFAMNKFGKGPPTIEELEGIQESTSNLGPALEKTSLRKLKLNLQSRPDTKLWESTPRKEDWELMQTVNNLLEASEQVREVLLPLLYRQRLLGLRAINVNTACWYGLYEDLYCPYISSLAVHIEVREDPAHFDRWLKQVVRLFPNLEQLRIAGVHTHKDRSIWGTRFKVNDLRAMTYLLSKTQMQYVYIMCPNGCHGQRRGFRCHGTVVFTKDIAKEGRTGIDVNAELTKAYKGPKKRSPSSKTPRRDPDKTCCDTRWTGD